MANRLLVIEIWSHIKRNCIWCHRHQSKRTSVVNVTKCLRPLWVWIRIIEYTQQEQRIQCQCHNRLCCQHLLLQSQHQRPSVSVSNKTKILCEFELDWSILIWFAFIYFETGGSSSLGMGIGLGPPGGLGMLSHHSHQSSLSMMHSHPHSQRLHPY